MDQWALDALLETKESFEIEDGEGNTVRLGLYPSSLGKMALMSKRLLDLDLTLDAFDGSDPLKEMWRICAERPRQVAEIIALATLRTKREIEERLEERTQLLLWSPSIDTRALVNLLHAIIGQGDCLGFMSAIRLLKTVRVNISQSA